MTAIARARRRIAAVGDPEVEGMSIACVAHAPEPLTLVDTGPNSGKALDELGSQLGARCHSIDDLELLIVTHQHIDHLGLVEIIVQHSRAEVAAIDVAVERLANFGEDA